MIKHNRIAAGAFGNGKPKQTSLVFNMSDVPENVIGDNDIILRCTEFTYNDVRMIAVPEKIIIRKYPNLINR